MGGAWGQSGSTHRESAWIVEGVRLSPSSALSIRLFVRVLSPMEWLEKCERGHVPVGGSVSGLYGLQVAAPVAVAHAGAVSTYPSPSPGRAHPRSLRWG